MQIIIMVSIILVTTAFLVGTVYFVTTLIQIRKTAKEFESFAHMINMTSPFFSLLFMGSSFVSSIVEKVKSFFYKKLESDTKKDIEHEHNNPAG
jgi:uncharacterized membrane protein